jgi:hypothetical protein
VNNLKYTTNAGSNIFNPNFVTGFVDAESCFSINILKNPFYNLGWKISLVFSIHSFHKNKDIDILYKFHKFFCVGNVNLYGDSAMFQITKLGDLVFILEHF